MIIVKEGQFQLGHLKLLKSKGIIKRKFVPNGQTITGAYYLEVLKRLMVRVRDIRPEYRDAEAWSFESMLHRYNKFIETGGEYFE